MSNISQLITFGTSRTKISTSAMIKVSSSSIFSHYLFGEMVVEVFGGRSMSFLYKPKTKNGDLIALPQLFHEILIINCAWPTRDGAVGFKPKLYHVLGWFVFLNLTFINFCECAAFFVNMTDIVKAVQSFCTAMTGLFVVLRSLHFRVFEKKFAMLLETFSKEIWIDRKKHPRIVEKCHQIMRPAFVFFMLIFVTLISYVVLPILIFYSTNQTLDSQDKRMPYLMVFPYDVQEGIAYIITYIFSVHAGWIIASNFYAHDAIILLFVSYLCGQFEILQNDITRLIPECHAEWQKRYGKIKNGDVKNDIHSDSGHIELLQDMYTKRLHQLSAHHSELISFCDQVNDLISFPLLMNIINSMFLICFCGFQFLVVSMPYVHAVNENKQIDMFSIVLFRDFAGGTTSFKDFIMFLSFFLSVTLQLFVICASGTLLITQSAETGAYLYQCDWEGGLLSKGSPLFLLPKDNDVGLLNTKLPLWKSIKYYPAGRDFRNKLRFMIMRSHRPLELNAMNFTIISLETFGKILSSSMSYFTLLKSFLDKEN